MNREREEEEKMEREREKRGERRGEEGGRERLGRVNVKGLLRELLQLGNMESHWGKYPPSLPASLR